MKCVYRNLYAKLRLDEGMTLLELTFAGGMLAMALSLLLGFLIRLTLVARLGADAAPASA